MKTYNVTITENLQMDVAVEAVDAAQARKIVERQWRNGDHILDTEHLKSATFTVQREQ